MGFLGRLGGLVLVAILCVAWISLLTWSGEDPSLTHATSGPTQNWLGPLGAIVSDLLLQMLGFAAAVALLSPMFWAIELTLRERVADIRLKLSLYPVAVLLLAGALSALPTTAGWPLNHGFGGILGDVMYGLAGSALAIIGGSKASALAGLLFFAAGFAAQAHSIGQNIKGLIDQAQQARSAVAAAASESIDRNRIPRLGFTFGGLFGARRKPSEIFEDAPGFAPATGDGYWNGDITPSSRTYSAPAAAMPSAASLPPLTAGYPEEDEVAPPALDRGLRHLDRDALAAREPASRGGSFDTSTEADSRAIAQRFAPPTSEAPRNVAAAAVARSARFLDTLTRRAAPAYKKPSLNQLKRPAGGKPSPDQAQAVLRGTARLLEDTLADFGIKGEIKDIKPGPVVTLYELEPARGTKSSRVIGLADDIARSMSASSARVAPVPGRNAIGIELPNARRETVLLREILETEDFRAPDKALPVALGKGIAGEAVVADLARMPHLLVAGTTGSGKSVGINAIILSLLYRLTPDECRLLMIDPKMLELSVYNGIPHLLTPVITEAPKAVAALEWAVGEMEERYKRMAKLAVRNIDVYNNRVRHAQRRGETLARTVQTGFDPATGQPIHEHETMALETMPFIVIVVDEFADLMIAAGPEIETAVQRLAQMARAAGIHLVMATQRPSVDIVTGTIKWDPLESTCRHASLSIL